jgi:hypothetical protein
MLSDGKAVPAQREAFLEGNLVKFAELAQPLNLKDKGTSEAPSAISTDDYDSKVLKLADKLQTENPKMERWIAIQLAKQQVKKQ